MADNNKSETKYRTHIPEEAREHYRTAFEEFRKGMSYILPEGFISHHKKAHKEVLLAWRSMLDAAIQQMDEKGKQAGG